MVRSVDRQTVAVVVQVAVAITPSVVVLAPDVHVGQLSEQTQIPWKSEWKMAVIVTWDLLLVVWGVGFPVGAEAALSRALSAVALAPDVHVGQPSEQTQILWNFEWKTTVIVKWDLLPAV